MTSSAEDLAKLCDRSLEAATRAKKASERIRHLESALRFAQAAYRKKVSNRVLDMIGHSF